MISRPANEFMLLAVTLLDGISPLGPSTSDESPPLDPPADQVDGFC